MEYYLIPNKISGDPNNYIARVNNLEITTFERVVEKMTRRGLTSTDTEVISTIKELGYVINEELSLGRAVVTPFAKFYPSISGIFNGKDDSFDSKRHNIKAKCSKGKEIVIDESKLQLVKVKHVPATPLIEGFLNYATQENDVITPGGTVEVTGELLKVDTSDNEQGIFLRLNGNATKISAIIHNLPSKLVFNIPAGLAQGDYQLEIRSKINGAATLRTGIYSETLQVL
jgi:hypothetical protein